MTQLESLMRRNFLEYASYVVLDRAIPELRDGLKPVQRRILHTMSEMDDGRFHKVANVIGETMKLHPHGDAAISDALVVLANKGFFIERQGNFGNIFTGHPAAAARYIECRLTPLARETMFFKEITEFAPSYDGRKEEPVCLPSKVPTLLMLGTEGIAVGMATKIMPHNFRELLEAQIELLRGNEVRVLPDFPQGGQVDVSEYDDGRGKVMVRAKLEARSDKSIVLTQLPYSTTTESIISSIENASQRGHIKIAGIQDYTSESVEVEIQLPRGVYAKEVIPQLFAYTDCEVSLSSNIVTIKDGRPVDLTVTQVLAFLTDQLLETLRKELEHELAKQNDKHHWLTLEQLFIEHRVYKRIEDAKTDEAVRKEVWDGMHEYAELFVRAMVDEDIDRLLQIRIRRISAYDIEKNRNDIEEVRAKIEALEKKLKRMKRTAISYLEGLIKQFGSAHPRRTKVATFKSIDKRKVARADIRLSYDPKSGFFGTKVKGTRFEFTVSEFDRILAICSDGSYRVMGPVEKILLPGKVVHCARFDAEKGADFTLVYRTKDKIAYAKRFRIEKFVKDKEYELIKDRKGKVDLLHVGDGAGEIYLEFVPSARQRVTDMVFDLSTVAEKGVSARGVRISPKPIQKVMRLRD